MLDLIFDELAFLTLVGGVAIILPFAMVSIAHAKPEWPRRPLWLIGGFGMWMIALWGAHELLIYWLGFDSIATALGVLGLGLGSGIAGGLWARAEAPRPQRPPG